MKRFSSLPLVIAAMAAMLGSSTRMDAQQSPIVVSPAQLTFNVQGGSATSTQQNLVILSNGPVPVAFTATAAGASNSLTLSASSGTTPQVLVVTANPGSLTQGSYGGFVTVKSGSGSTTVPVVIDVNSTGATPLSATPNPLVFTFPPGSTVPQTQSLDTFLTAGGTTAVTATPSTSDNGTWLSVNPGSGSTLAFFNVSVNPSGLGTGVFFGAIAINAPGTTGLVVPVTVNIPSPSALNVSPQQLSFAFQTGTTAPAAQSLTLTTDGSSPINFTATPSFPNTNTCGTNWLVVSPQSSSTPSTLSVQINTNGLPTGTCMGNIDISAPSATNPTQSIPVSLLVSSNPLLQLPTGGVTFDFQTGTATPASQTIPVTSSSSPLNFTAMSTPVSGGPDFLTISPASGTTPQALTLSVNPAVLAGLAPNTYAENVTVSSTGAGNPAQTFTVTLVVSNNPMLVSSQTNATFNFQIGQAPPASQVLTLTSTGGPLSYTVVASSNNCNNFLSATPSAGTTATQTGQTSQVTLKANTTGLTTPETCTGSVIISAPRSSTPPLTIPVQLNVSNTPLINASPVAIHVVAVAGSTATTQTIALTSTDNTTALNFTATAITVPAGLTWLSVTPNTGNTPANLMVSITPGTLASGVYNGSIMITSTSANVPAQVIPVTLTVATGTINVSPGSLTFTQSVGAMAPPSRMLEVTGIPQGATVGASATIFNGSNWLSVTSSGSMVTVTANGSQLTQGTYSGVVTVFVPGTSNSPFNVPVTLNVGSGSAQTFTLTQSTVNFTIQAGAIVVPGPQNVQLTAPTGNVQFNAVAVAPPGTAGVPVFVTVSPASGTAPATLTIGLIQSAISTLTPGTYTNLINLTSPTAPGAVQSITVTLTVTTPGPPSVTAIISGATLQVGTVSPGEVVTIFGINVGPITPVSLKLTPDGKVSTMLDDTMVTFNGVAAPLIFVSPGQINAIVPYQVSGSATATVVVTHGGVMSSSVSVNVSTTAPGIFTLNLTGTGQGAILDQNSTINGPGNPAARGSVVVIYATGEGLLNPQPQTGSVTPSTGSIDSFPVPKAPVSVTIGGVKAKILFMGEAPGFVSGVIQINAVVPKDIGTGNQKVVLTIGDNMSNPDVTAAIK